MANQTATIKLKKGEGRVVRAGGMWIYDNEIDAVSGEFADGDIVEVVDANEYFLGYGFINTRSKITIRLMSRKKDVPVDEVLLEQRVRDAIEYRKAVTDMNCCRLVFGEADFLPGLTVDKFADVLVMECLALGMERMKARVMRLLVSALEKEGYPVQGVYERSDAKVRELEGLPRVKGFLDLESGELYEKEEGPFNTKIEIKENDVRYYVDIRDGQKTGFFLDQKYNRMAVRKLCKDKDVLDCFTHTGSFALNAAYAGAKSVLGVDASLLAIEQARENAALNGFTNVSFQTADIFDLLPELISQKKKYDVVILDPPAFTKSRASVKKAVTGYRELNLRGMQLVKKGGFLATCSCSHFMEPELLLKTIQEAARGARVTLRQVEYRQQAPDHPILLTNDASYYLKFYIFQVISYY